MGFPYSKHFCAYMEMIEYDRLHSLCPNVKAVIHKKHLKAAKSMNDCSLLSPSVKSNDSSNPTGLSTSQPRLTFSFALASVSILM